MRQYFIITNDPTGNLSVDLSCFDKLVIYEWSIPYTFYNIVSPHNVFTDSVTSMIIPPGNYTSTSLKTHMESSSPGLTVTFNPLTYKTTLSKTTNWNMIYTPFLELLGFTRSQSITGLNTYTSENIFNLNKNINNLFIQSTNLYNTLNYKPMGRDNQTDGFVVNINTSNFSFGSVITNFNGRDITLPIHTNSNQIPSVSCRLSSYDTGEINMNGQEILIFCYVE